MHNWIDDRNFSGSKNFQALNLISKAFNPLIKNRFELNNFKRLPVIKEEEGNPNEDEPALQKNHLQRELRKNYRSKKGSHMKEVGNVVKNYKKITDSKSITRLPPLGSVNCLLENSIRQAPERWETKLGKYLMNGKNFEEDLNLSENKVSSNLTKKSSEKFGDGPSSKTFQRRKFTQEQNVRNDVGDAVEVKQTKKKKSKKPSAKDPNLKNMYSQEKVQSKKVLEGTLSVPSFTKSQQFLTDSIQSSVNGHPREINCKNSEGVLSIENFCKQKKQQEAEKETCLLCEKVFYNSQKFVQHILTHETVDKFSCKKCKTHFINLRKYKEHCKDFHSIPSDEVKKPNLECAKKWLPKFECKRCKVLFDSEPNYEAHRRMHIKKDLAEEYF